MAGACTAQKAIARLKVTHSHTFICPIRCRLTLATARLMVRLALSTMAVLSHRMCGNG